MVENLDLTRVRIVRRQSRNIIALESTPDGFDLYLYISLNAAAPFEVTIVISQRD